MLQLITDNWSIFYPPIHTNIVFITMEQSIIAGDNSSGPWAPLDYPSTCDLMKELGDLCYDWKDPTHEQYHDLGELCYNDGDLNHDSTNNDITIPVTSPDTQWSPLSYLDMTDFIDDVRDCINPFLTWGTQPTDEDIDPCPSPPAPPLPPPTMNPPPFYLFDL